MALSAIMFTPQTNRLAHLKLDGLRWGVAVFFCPNCDFQYEHEPVRRACPECDHTLEGIAVTPDLVQLARAAA